jgi:hypothetical protein
MPFLGRLAVMLAGSPSANAQPNWVLLEPLQYEDVRGKVHTVPEGFTTDFASVPRLPFAYAAYGNRGQAIRAAVLHDYYCRTELVPRIVADELFLEAMLADGMPEADAKVMYWAVRLYTQGINGGVA